MRRGDARRRRRNGGVRDCVHFFLRLPRRRSRACSLHLRRGCFLREGGKRKRASSSSLLVFLLSRTFLLAPPNYICEEARGRHPLLRIPDKIESKSSLHLSLSLSLSLSVCVSIRTSERKREHDANNSSSVVSEFFFYCHRPREKCDDGDRISLPKCAATR